MGFSIDMIDVGQGDAFLLTLADVGHDTHILIDAGVAEAGPTVSRFIKEHAAGRIDLAIVSHLDRDHLGGMYHVVKTCNVRSLFMNLPTNIRSGAARLASQRARNMKSSPQWEQLEKSLASAADLAELMQPYPITAGMSGTFGDVTIKVLNPTEERLKAAWEELERDETEEDTLLEIVSKAMGFERAPETSAENNSSVVLEVVYKNEPYALFTGDAGADVLREVTGGRRYQFLKVPHHGSKTGLDEALIEQFRPQTAYIPVGENQHGHPCMEVLDLLKSVGAKTYCSQKTIDCRRECPSGGFGSMCHLKDRDARAGWSTVDHLRCLNNRSA
jgi:beta-lactamase superfamily II metal-dependent hydrolase